MRSRLAEVATPGPVALLGRVDAQVDVLSPVVLENPLVRPSVVLVAYVGILRIVGAGGGVELPFDDKGRGDNGDDSETDEGCRGGRRQGSAKRSRKR